MRIILKLIINALTILAMSHWFSGIAVNSFFTAVLVAVIIAILNVLVKPLLVIITIPVTILTLGLFLIVINAIIVKMASALVGGFEVYGWVPAILFALILGFINALLEADGKKNKE
ncbi:MAG: phage holin family protein [Luteibaculum sp.]